MKYKTIFTFCPSCQSKLTHVTNRLLNCNRCGFHFYLNPAITNALILENKKGEILLVKRKYPPKKGRWDLPGGFIEFNETVEESLEREIKEELGIKTKNLKYIGSQPDRYLYKGINYHTLCMFFTGQIKNGKIVSQDDISTVKFFSKKNLPFKKIAFTGIKKALIDYLK